MQVFEKKIQDILGESNVFSIPDYQRPYSWEEKNIKQLLEDLQEAFDQGDKEYFIGSLILIEQNKNHYDVVDGQQRLTTLTIILSVIRDLMKAQRSKDHMQNRILPSHALTGIAEEPRLNVRPQDRSLFYEAILTGADVEETDDLSDSQINILRNKAAAAEHLKTMDQENLTKFALYIESNVWAVWVATGNVKSALRLFNVLNARGLPLSNGDLVKSFLFAKLMDNKEKQQVFKDAWDEMESLIGLKKLDSFLGHYRTSHMANKANMTTYEEYEVLFDTLKLTPDAFAKALLLASKQYLKIINNDFDSAAVKRHVASLLRVSYDEWIPPLLAFLDAKIEGFSLDEFSALLEKVTYQNWVRRLGRAKRNTIYYNLISRIRSGGTSELKKVFMEGMNADEFISILSGNVYSMPYARAVLLRLEEAAQDESVTKIYSGLISIEHVLPQKPTDRYWKERFSEEDVKLWVHRLGNITLLSGRKNTAAQNYDFGRKKSVYNDRQNKNVSFDLTKSVCDEQDWTIDVLKKRQEILINDARKVWVH